MTAPSFAEIANAKDILLTTFTKDGTPKPTAIWAAPDGDRLLVMTEEDSWKVKRIRNTPRVTLAICDPRGKPKSHSIEAVARVLDKSEALAVQRAVNKRYGVLGWLFGVYMEGARARQEERRRGAEGGLEMAETFEDVARSKYLLLTTFTKDGKAKPTAIWAAPDGDRLVVITDVGSWKTKRIRNTSRVTIQRCGALGKPKGEPVEAVARMLPKDQTKAVYNAVIKRYWWHAWWFVTHSIVRGGIDKVHVGIELTPA